MPDANGVSTVEAGLLSGDLALLAESLDLNLDVDAPSFEWPAAPSLAASMGWMARVLPVPGDAWPARALALPAPGWQVATEGLQVPQQPSAVPEAQATAVGVQGIAYHWRSHQLLEGVAVQTADMSAVEPTPSQRLDLRAASMDAVTGRLAVDVWVNPVAEVKSVDFSVAGPAGSTLAFASVLGNDWAVLANASEPGALILAAFQSDLLAAGLTQPTRLGTLQVQALPGAADLQLAFADVFVGAELVPVAPLEVAHAVSGTGGEFHFTAAPPEAGMALRASREPDADAAPAVNLQDAVAILKMIAGQPVNPGGRALSPYQALAADFDGNGAVSLADALGVLRHAVGLLAAAAPRWTFVDEADPGMPSRAAMNPGPVPTTLSGVTPVAGHVGLVGVLRGDVDGSWEAPAGTPQLEPAYFTNLLGRLGAEHPSAGFDASQWGVYPA